MTDDVPTTLYRHYDAGGTLLYVGISLTALHRLAQHHDVSPWSDQIATVKHERFETRELAHAAERKAIQTENPKFNRMRYTVKDEAKRIMEHAEESRRELVRRLVKYNPMYSIEAAAEVLQLGVKHTKWLIETGTLGHVSLGTWTKHYKGELREYQSLAVTGWQIIDYIERLEQEAFAATNRRGARS